MKHEAVSKPLSGIQFCSCNEGFSGHRARERLLEHIDNPDPNSLGRLLIDLQHQVEPE
jgi:hypothetical protein